jgi:hypothetical protein
VGGHGVPPGNAPVLLDDRAWEEDMAATSERARETAAAARRRFAREGIAVMELRPCLAEGPDQTRLAGCMKTYVPWPDGRFGMVFAVRRHQGRAALVYLAFGVRHHPPEAHAPSVYAIAHRRLHGRWPPRAA